MHYDIDKLPDQPRWWPADGLCIDWGGGADFLLAAHEPLGEGEVLRPALYRKSPRDPSLFLFTP